MAVNVITLEANPICIYADVRYTISYKESYNKLYALEDKYRDTTLYNQTIKIFLSIEPFRAYNHSVLALRTGLEKKRWRDMSDEERQKYLHLTRLREGRNYVNLTTLKYVASFFHIDEDKRYKNDRNTLIKVEIL